MASRFAHLIFDLDDTLIDSFPQYAAMHQQIAGDLGMRVPSIAELADYRTTWEETLATYWPGVALEPFMRRYEQVADDFVYPAVEGVVPTLRELAERGHRLWIVTKRSRRRLAARMGAAGIPSELFEGIFPLEDQPAAKPDPRCFEPVRREIGSTELERSAYVGDRREDMLAAHAAGLTFVAVKTGPERGLGFTPELPESHVLDSAASIPSWLDALGGR
jgi:phosphoglycolate phosphatase